MHTNHSVGKPAIPPVLGVACAILAVSTSSIFTRYAQGLAPSLVIAAHRLLLASLVVWPITLARHRDALATMSRRQAWLAILSGALLAIHFATWITSLEYTTVASSVVLVSTAPLFVALLAPSTLGERLTRPIILGLALSLGGILIVGLSDACTRGAGWDCPTFSSLLQGKALLGDLLALLGGAAVAGYMLIGRSLRTRLPLLPYISLTYGSAAIVLIVVMLVAGNKPFGYPPQSYLWFALLALVPQLVAHSTYNWALRYLPASFVSIALLGEPVGSTLLAFLLLGEQPAVWMLVGGALILAGVAMASRG